MFIWVDNTDIANIAEDIDVTKRLADIVAHTEILNDAYIHC